MEEFRFYCDKCHYGTNKKSCYNQHLKTTKHLTGKRKPRSDKQDYEKCKICGYISENKMNYLNHYLNNHATLEERREQFKYYCITCDFGCFVESIFNKHINTSKHKIKSISKVNET